MVGDILQPTHLLFILVIALLVLGPKRLPEVGRSLGRGLRDFRSAVSGEGDHLGFMTESTDEAQPAPAEPNATTEAEPAATTEAEPAATAEAEPAATTEAESAATTDVAASPEAETPAPPLAAAATATGEPSRQHSD